MSHEHDAPPPLPTNPIPVIDYDTPPRADHVTRRKYLVLLVLASVFGAVLLGGLLIRVATSMNRGTVIAVTTPAPPVPLTARVVTPSASPKTVGQMNAEQFDLLRVNGRLAPTQVVYEEEPIRGRRLREQGIGDGEPARWEVPQPYYSAFEPPVYRTDGIYTESGKSQDALLFAHELVSPGGNRRLVLFEMEVKLTGSAPADETYQVAIARQLKYRICASQINVWLPEVLRSGRSLTIRQADGRHIIPIRWTDGTLRAERPAAYNIRFFAGQPDPADPSHFTIDYELGNVRNTIDAYLTDDDFLRILPRAGRVDRGEWRIDAAP